MQKIIIYGYMGRPGAAIIAENKREELLHRFRPDFIDSITDYGDPISLTTLQGCEIRKVGEGGILKALYDIAEEKRCGMRVELKRVPFLQSTIELCELYSLNPYRLLSDGCVVLSEDEEEITRLLTKPQMQTRQHLRRKAPAVCIGELTGGRDKIITDKSEIQYMDRPTEDEIYKFKKSL